MHAGILYWYSEPSKLINFNSDRGIIGSLGWGEGVLWRQSCQASRSPVRSQWWEGWYSLGPSIEKIKIPELQSDPLSGLSEKLITTSDILRIGSFKKFFNYIQQIENGDLKCQK